MNEMFLYRVECISLNYKSKWYEKIGSAKANKIKCEKFLSIQHVPNAKFNLVTYKLVKV